MLDKNLLDILVCPVSGGALKYDHKKQLLICAKSGLAYPVRDGIPVLLEEEAQKIKATRVVKKPSTGKRSNP